jgi:hypothetical protein
MCYRHRHNQRRNLDLTRVDECCYEEYSGLPNCPNDEQYAYCRLCKSEKLNPEFEAPNDRGVMCVYTECNNCRTANPFMISSVQDNSQRMASHRGRTALLPHNTTSLHENPVPRADELRYPRHQQYDDYDHGDDMDSQYQRGSSARSSARPLASDEDFEEAGEVPEGSVEEFEEDEQSEEDDEQSEEEDEQSEEDDEQSEEDDENIEGDDGYEISPHFIERVIATLKLDRDNYDQARDNIGDRERLTEQEHKVLPSSRHKLYNFIAGADNVSTPLLETIHCDFFCYLDIEFHNRVQLFALLISQYFGPLSSQSPSQSYPPAYQNSLASPISVKDN